jgi:hypothetical protein
VGVATPRDGVFGTDAVRLDNSLLNCQKACLPSPNDPPAVVAVLRLLGDEGGVVGGGGAGIGVGPHCG